jgi:RNA polymerase sigma factor (sigma-70 family)
VADRKSAQKRSESAAPADHTTNRDRLILEYLPLVQSIARRYQERFPSSFSLDDLVHAGVLGLFSVLDEFDPTTGPLKVYVDRKIKVAIRDTLRSTDWASRKQSEDRDEHCLDERDNLLARKYTVGLEPHGEKRLAEIDRLLEREEARKAELIDAEGDQRLARIDEGLDRVERAIRDLQALNVH